jgi:hypothetical protein
VAGYAECLKLDGYVWISALPQFDRVVAASGANSFEFDNVVAAAGFPGASSAIPEPSTWAMLLLGFAGLGYASYRAPRRTDRAIA